MTEQTTRPAAPAPAAAPPQAQKPQAQKPQAQKPQARLVGRLVAIEGAEATCLLDNALFDDPKSPAAPRLGALVAMETPTSIVYGVVGSMTMNPIPGAPVTADHRFGQIDLMGEVLKPTRQDPDRPLRFERGVSMAPTLGSAVRSTVADDIALVYARPGSGGVRVGAIHQNARVPAYVMVDDLLSKHFAILGNTGSGKSCTVALILRKILEANPAGHVILLDPHDEYAAAFDDLAEVVDPTTLHIPYWLLTFKELIDILVVEGDEVDKRSQISILRDALMAVRRSSAPEGIGEGQITVDTPIPYRLNDLIKIIDNAMGALDKPDASAPFRRLLTRLYLLNSDKRYAFMFSGFLVRDTMPEVLSRIMRVPVQGRPLTVIDLSGVPSEVVDVVVSVIARMCFDFAFWSAHANAVPVVLVCEEAHRYVPRDTPNAPFLATRLALGRIAKEGRKYGVGLGLITQRPSELSETVLAQCGTLFALRLNNERDQEFVHRAMPENARSLMSVLPALRTQEAVAVGEGVSVPMRIRFASLPPEHQPRSSSAKYTDAWAEDAHGEDFLLQTIQLWRHQQR